MLNFLFKRKVEPEPIKKDNGVFDSESDWQEITTEYSKKLFTPDDLLNLYFSHWLIYATVYITANSIARLPFILINEKGEIVDDINLSIRKILQRPNQSQTWGDLLEKTFLHLELNGNAYWELVKGDNGKLATIYNLNPTKILLNRDYRGKTVSYTYLGDNRNYTLILDEVIHFYYQSPIDDEIGVSPIQSLIPNLLLDIYLTLHYQNFFKNAAIPSGILETDQSLNPTILKRLEVAWKKFYMGIAKHYKPVILDSGLKYKTITTLPKDIPFSELEDRVITKILGVLNVPPILVGILKEASYSNALHQYKVFWDGIKTKANKVAEKITYILLPYVGLDGWTFKFDLSEVEALTEDRKVLTEIRRLEILSRIKTPNEVRQEMGLEPIEGGDVLFTPGAGLSKTERDIIEIVEREDKRIGYEEWFNFIKISIPREEEFILSLIGAFKKQKKDILANLENHFESQDIQRILFDIDTYNKLLIKKTFPIYHRTIKETAEMTIEEVRTAILRKAGKIKKQVNPNYSYNPKDTVIIKWIEDACKKFSYYVNDTTIKLLQQELLEGFNEGETIKELADRVKMVFSDLISITGSRAILIARTEITSASNFIKDEMYKKMEVPKKQWVASFGAPVPPRPAHLEAHLQIVGRDENFLVGGEFLSYPGDPAGSPMNRCNCRCITKAILE